MKIFAMKQAALAPSHTSTTREVVGNRRRPLHSAICAGPHGESAGIMLPNNCRQWKRLEQGTMMNYKRSTVVSDRQGRIPLHTKPCGAVLAILLAVAGVMGGCRPSHPDIHPLSADTSSVSESDETSGAGSRGDDTGSGGTNAISSRPMEQSVLAAGADWISPSTGMEFVWIQTLGLWVGKYEVTNEEYRKKEPEHDSGSSYFNRFARLDGARQPAVKIEFDDAREYAVWLTERDRAYLNAGRYRLPTETEWEVFARCGDEREFPWGDDWPPPSGQSGNYYDRIPGYTSGFRGTAPVDELWENPWGLFGVGGNAWEPCATDETGEKFSAWRGASWMFDDRKALRVDCRDIRGGSGASSDRGFRLVLSPSSP